MEEEEGLQVSLLLVSATAKDNAGRRVKANNKGQKWERELKKKKKQLKMISSIK